jgi:hypothetical protein
MSSTHGHGRLCNQVVRNVASSVIAEKFDLCITYHNFNMMKDLNIPLFYGKNTYGTTAGVNNNNYVEILNRNSLNDNLRFHDYLSTNAISTYVHNYICKESIIDHYIEKNPHKLRFNNNNDCFVHIRLGDVTKYNPGFEYYDSVLQKLDVNKIYISSDTPNHNIIQRLLKNHQNASVFHSNPIDTIHFGSTCKYIVLSNGTFSAILGYLGYHSTVYYKKLSKDTRWDDFTDMNSNKFSKIGPWIEISETTEVEVPSEKIVQPEQVIQNVEAPPQIQQRHTKHSLIFTR